MSRINRRHFVGGCSAAIASLAGARFSGLAFADPTKAVNHELLVYVFLRGGLDGLSLVPPIAGVNRTHYEAARADLQVPISGAAGTYALPLDASFGLHPAATGLYSLYQAGRLAVVQAVGLSEAQRSHFDAMEYIERGTPGDRTTPTGWLTRHLASVPGLPASMVMPSISVGNLQATSLLGDRATVNMSDPDSFNLEVGPWQWRDALRTTMRHLYTSDSTWLHATGLQALDAADIVELNTSGSYTPANGAVYPPDSFGAALQVVAQMTKLELGLRVAAVDLGGWDTHNGQGNGSGGYFSGLVGTLSEGLTALYTDLDGAGAANYTQRLTVVVQSEFGRRLRENDDGGTDHGFGNVMMVLGGSVVGGVHGSFPGLATEQLFDNADLAVTNDYRRVLAEILIRRLGNRHLGTVFPGYHSYLPIGVVAGVDLEPDYSTPLWNDGFETGDVSRWSAAVV